MKSVLIVIADGTEEIEAVTLIDILRRAEFQVTVAGVTERSVFGAHQINLVADKLLSACESDSYDGIFLPGGMPGAENLAKSALLVSMLKKQVQLDKYYGAVCASPAIVLAQHGLLEGKKSTAYPGFESQLPDVSLAKQKVVVDGKCITGQSPGAAMEFALAIIHEMAGEQKSAEVRQGLC